MSDDQSRSGSRWEPPADASPLPADPPAGTTPDPASAAPTPWWKRRPSGFRPAIAAGIAAVALVGIGGGYAVGRAVDDDPTRPAGFTDGEFGHHDGDGRFGGEPGGDGALPPGGPGTGDPLPGAPGLEGDDDGDLDDGTEDGQDDQDDDGAGEDEASST